VNAEEIEAKFLYRSDRVDETRVGDRVVLYHRDTGSGVVLNPAGSRIWDSLATPASANALVERLARENLTVPRDRIAADVATYVASLKEQKLIDERR
jgi:hypothetical protein